MKIFICESCEFEATQQEADKLGCICPRDDGYLIEVDEPKETVSFDNLGDLWDENDTQ